MGSKERRTSIKIDPDKMEGEPLEGYHKESHTQSTIFKKINRHRNKTEVNISYKRDSCLKLQPSTKESHKLQQDDRR